MVNEVLLDKSLDKSFVQRIGAFPAVGYPLIFGWRRGWVPVPKGVAKVPVKDGRTLRCDLSVSTQRTMALVLFEPAESRLVKELLNPRDAFVDVGAHIGWGAPSPAQSGGQEGQRL